MKPRREVAIGHELHLKEVRLNPPELRRVLLLTLLLDGERPSVTVQQLSVRLRASENADLESTGFAVRARARQVAQADSASPSHCSNPCLPLTHRNSLSSSRLQLFPPRTAPSLERLTVALEAKRLARLR